MKKYLLICCCMIMVCCSSLPKKIEPQAINFAHMKMQFGHDAQKQQKFAKALNLYREAYDLFTRVDHIEGKIDAGLSIARQYFYLDQPDALREWLNLASDLIHSQLPQREGAKIILLIEMAFVQEDFQKVIAIPAAAAAANLEWRMEILCYTMAAKARLKLDYHPELKQVLEGLKELEKRFRKRRLDDPEVLGFAYYYTGYMYSVEKDWPAALGYFTKAKEIDGLIDNPYGVAKALYSQGQCHEKLGSFEKAAGCFARAAEIYALLDDDAAMEKAKKRADAAIGKK